MKDSVPIKYLATINRSVLPEDTDPNFTFQYIDISQVDSIGTISVDTTATMRFRDAPSRARRLAPTGATVVSTVRTYLRAIAQVPIVDAPLVFSTGFAVLEPNASDPRYFSYACRSTRFVDEVVARSTGVSYPAINPSELGNILMPSPPLEEQRRIAEFLDDRVARIDQIIAGRRQQRDMVAFEAAALLPRALTMRGQSPLGGPDVPTSGWSLAAGWRVAPLGRLLVQLTNGFVGPTRDILADEGVRYIQGTHIKYGMINFERHPYYVSEDWARSRPRIMLRPKDIVLVQTGAIGEVAMVPEDFGEASCHALLIARTNRDVADPAYLTEYLRSASGQTALLARATGALHPHLEFGIKSVPVLFPTLMEQREIAAEVRCLRDEIAGVTGAITTSIALLQEYKQSLITAAVTGELDVTTASTRIPE